MADEHEVQDVVQGDGYAVANVDALGEGPGFRKVRRQLGNLLVLDSHIGSQPAIGGDHRSAAKNHATHAAPARSRRGT